LFVKVERSALVAVRRRRLELEDCRSDAASMQHPSQGEAAGAGSNDRDSRGGGHAIDAPYLNRFWRTLDEGMDGHDVGLELESVSERLVPRDRLRSSMSAAPGSETSLGCALAAAERLEKA
jgi:hypothetical protein